MRISEMLSSPMPEQQKHENEGRSLKVIEEIETSIRQFEESHNNKSLTLELLSSNLDKNLSRLNALSSATPLSNSIKLQIWKLSYRLWNACVDLSNATITTTSSSQVQVQVQAQAQAQAKLRQFAADLLLLARDVSGIPSHLFKSASFYYKTGLIWHDLNKFDLAANCFERATDLTATANVNEISDVGEQRLLLDLNIARSKTAWEVSERNLAITLLNRSKNLLFGSPESFKALANQYLVFGKLVLSKQQEQKTMEAIQEALKLMNEALDLCDKGLRMVKRPDEDDSAAYLSLKTMRSKTLRFMAAAHLQGEEFQSVLKCIRFLREEDEQHPSLPVLAMKAWLGLGKCFEAEKELRGMVVNKGIPESIWLSAVEAYFQATGGVAAAETAKGLFLGLLGRCHVSANAAVRVAHRVISGSGVSSGCSRARAKVVAELVSDERVMLLFAAGAGQDGEANATTAMHAVLWNCGADHFRAKDYETSAEMFEKSMLYVPHNVENKILRAKCFRVLCLCHLGLSHLDQAHEYVNEAEKLHPNIACAFLKFKIHLQKKDENGAINQLKAMTSCLDFTPDFLILSAHEAIASTALPVAISSLSNLLNFYSPGKPMPTPQVVVFRTLVVLLSRDPGNEHEILNFLKLAQTKMLELNPENFFGKGEVGRRERNWFAVISWNYGSRAGIQKKYELCAEFLVLASQFYGVTMNGEAEGNHAMVCRCLILSVSAMIASEKQGNAALSDSEVNRALELLNKAGKVLALTSCGTQQADDPTNIEPNFFFMHTCNSYEIQSRLADHIHQDQQLILIKNFASSKACTPQYLLQLGLNALQGQRPNYSVADYTLNTCLSTLLSSPSPEYKTIFVIVRKLIGLAGFKKGDANDEAYSLYKQAYRIMIGLKEGQYPTEEAKWLATTAWNHAALPVRIGQIGTAKKWMRMGLELAQHVPAASSYKECMDKFLVEFEEKFDGHDNV